MSTQKSDDPLVPSPGPSGAVGAGAAPLSPGHDLVPVHQLLLKLAQELQAKVDAAIREICGMRRRLSQEMLATAAKLEELGEVVVPLGGEREPAWPCPQHTLESIHLYRDQAVAALRSQAKSLEEAGSGAGAEEGEEVEGEAPLDFNSASDKLDSSFQVIKAWLDQVGSCATSLQSCDGAPAASSLRRFNTDRCRDIDSLEKAAVLCKLSELRLSSCSLQTRKPSRSLGHTLDLQEIMLAAKNAKSLVYEVSLHMLKMVDSVRAEEVETTTVYHRLTKENSDLLRRYCFYLKLKIWQL